MIDIWTNTTDLGRAQGAYGLVGSGESLKAEKKGSVKLVHVATMIGVIGAILFVVHSSSKKLNEKLEGYLDGQK